MSTEEALSARKKLERNGQIWPMKHSKKAWAMRPKGGKYIGFMLSLFPSYSSTTRSLCELKEREPTTEKQAKKWRYTQCSQLLGGACAQHIFAYCTFTENKKKKQSRFESYVMRKFTVELSFTSPAKDSSWRKNLTIFLFARETFNWFSSGSEVKQGDRLASQFRRFWLILISRLCRCSRLQRASCKLAISTLRAVLFCSFHSLTQSVLPNIYLSLRHTVNSVFLYVVEKKKLEWEFVA